MIQPTDPYDRPGLDAEQCGSTWCLGPIGSSGDAYDNALAEITIGLFKTEAIGPGSSFRTGPLRILDDVEHTAMEWVDWYNNRRLHSQLDYTPPEEYETAYYAHLRASQPATSQP